MLLIILPSTNVRGQTISDLFQQVEPAVVVIRTVERETSADPRQPVSFRSLGSGVLVSGDGRVLTASHVVQAADQVGVEFSTGHVSLARVLASVPSADIAVLQLQDPPPDVEPAVLADSDEMRIGEEVIVIGAPYGIARTLTVGHLSGRRAPGEVDNDQMMTAEFFQTDAAINTGNSGGPMLNLRGEVIGIVSHILTQGGGFEGLGFAVTSNSARRLLLERPSFWTGIEGHIVRGRLAQLLNLPQDAGILVQRIAAGSPGADLGLEAGHTRATVGDDEVVLGGDIVLSVAGVQIQGDGSGLKAIADSLKDRTRSGTTVVVLRRGKLVELTDD